MDVHTQLARAVREMGTDWDSVVYHAACQWKNMTNQTFADSASLSTMIAFQQQDGSKSEKKRKHIWEWFAEQKRDSTLNWCPQAKPKQRFKRTQNPSEYTHSIFYISLKCNFILCCSSAYFSSIPSMRLKSSCQIVTFNSIFVPFPNVLFSVLI